jgi:succinate-semialdehyde dehydrogenase/glutarate-semialdehyde dehydrogenase
VSAEASRVRDPADLLLHDDPLIVLDTDDLDETVKATATARMRNRGQSCNAPKRMITLADLYADFVDRLSKYVADQRSGLGRELGPAGLEKFMNKKSIRL